MFRTVAFYTQQHQHATGLCSIFALHEMACRLLVIESGQRNRLPVLYAAHPYCSKDGLLNIFFWVLSGFGMRRAKGLALFRI